MENCTSERVWPSSASFFFISRWISLSCSAVREDEIAHAGLFALISSFFGYCNTIFLSFFFVICWLSKWPRCSFWRFRRNKSPEQVLSLYLPYIFPFPVLFRVPQVPTRMPHVRFMISTCWNYLKIKLYKLLVYRTRKQVIFLANFFFFSIFAILRFLEAACGLKIVMRLRVTRDLKQ